MIQLQVLQKIGVLAISLLLGYGYFFAINQNDRTAKLQMGQVLTSLLIDFIICLWIGKVLTKFQTFWHDPMAVLAYPSDAKAFYVASCFMLLYSIWLTYRKKLQVRKTISAAVIVFLAASFVFECIQILMKQQMNWQYALLLLVLILLHVLFHDRLAANLLAPALLWWWGIGEIIISLWQGYTTIFGFVLSGWYAAIIILASTILLYRWRLDTVKTKNDKNHLI